MKNCSARFRNEDRFTAGEENAFENDNDFSYDLADKKENLAARVKAHAHGAVFEVIKRFFLEERTFPPAREVERSPSPFITWDIRWLG